MEVMHYPAARAGAAPTGGSVVTIGAFDGVHVGHRMVIESVLERARRTASVSVVVTFDRHPAAVVRPHSAPKLLTDLDQKLELLAAGGVDRTVVVQFDEVRAEEPAEEFVTELLVGCLSARAVVVGEDFHFGRDRMGNVALLRRMGDRLGFEVVALALQPPALGEPPVSSTRIRQCLAGGDVDTAARLLGRLFELRGRVTVGDRRGRALGFPTANVGVEPEVLVPGAGIYAGWYERPGGHRHPAAISVGPRATFHEDGPSVVEAHLLDFDGDLYGQEARVRFATRLREDVKFASATELVAQIARDVEATRAALR